MSRYYHEEIETMSRNDLEAYQLEKLKEIVAFAYENSAYYKRSLDNASVSPAEIASLADIGKLPFIDKATERETQGVGSFIGELAAVPEKDVVFVSASSGSTGVPTLSPFTQNDFDEWMGVESRLFYQTGMRDTDRYMHAINFSLFVGGPCVIGAQRLGALCIWAGTLPSERLLYIIQQFKPTIIQTTPSYAWYLGETAKKRGIDPAKDLSVRKIIVAGEPGGSIEATRRAIEKLWNAEVFDFFGMSDIFGAFASVCEAKDGLHVAEDHILVETVDPATGETLNDGEVGELVFTSLRKHARPMLRFRSGDIGFVDKSKCKCGRTHLRLHIIGRKDDMFIVSGVNIFPSDIESVIKTIEGITGEYLIRVFERNYTACYAVSVEKNEENSESDAEITARISAALKAKIGVKPNAVVVLKAGQLPREAHKAKRVIDEIKA